MKTKTGPKRPRNRSVGKTPQDNPQGDRRRREGEVPAEQPDRAGQRAAPRARIEHQHEPRRAQRRSSESRPPERRPPSEHRAPAEHRAKGLWLHGHHAVLAALRNPRRTLHRLIATEEALAKLGDAVAERGLKAQPVVSDELERLLPPDTPHQGVALQAAPLAPLALDRTLIALPENALVLALDQITDPRNFGAIARSALALGCGALIVPERRTAELNAAAHKAASGALDVLPLVEVTNLRRSFDELKEADFWVTGLAGEAERTLFEAKPSRRRALVLGSEGQGMRRTVAEACDEVVRIPINPEAESLNVSVAAGIAVFEFNRIDGR